MTRPPLNRHYAWVPEGHLARASRLDRPLWARVLGPFPILSGLAWPLLVSFPIAAVGGDVDIDPWTLIVLGLATTVAAAQWTAWAEVDDEGVSWRSLIRVNRVPINAIGAVTTTRAWMPGEVLRLALMVDGGDRRHVRPSTGVGQRRLDEFQDAIKGHLNESPT